MSVRPWRAPPRWRSLPLAFAGTLALLAGCAVGPGPGATAGLDPIYASGHVSGFAAVDVADLGSGAEPGLRVAPDGTLYTIAWTRVFASSDGGATWRALATPFQQNGDSDLAIAGDGTLHVVGMRLANEGAPFLPHWRSADQGATWTMVSDLHPDGPIDRPWIAVAPDGRLLTAWNDFELRRVTIQSSGDGGDSWGKPFHIDAHWYPMLSRPAFRGDETFVPMHYPIHDGQANVLAHQAAPGGAWTILHGPATPLEFFLAPLAVDGEGALHLVGVVPGNDGPQVHHWQSQDGREWTDGARVSQGVEAVMPWPVPLRRGVAIAFYQATVVPDERLPPLQILTPLEPTLEWHAVVALRSGDGWRTVPTTNGPVHMGPMCTRASDCSEGAQPFFDLFEATALPSGGIAVAHVVHGDQRVNARPGLVVARSS